MTNFEYDSDIRNGGIQLLCGVDEAGRGPLCGPVYAAAVILPEGVDIPGLNDSKKISEKKRELLFDEICEKAIAYSVAFSTVEEIESLNILQATMLAMKRAVDGLGVKPDKILIDGNRIPKDLPSEASFVIKGDALSATIGAASILAKVSRDRELRELDKKHPEYGFAKHKGYGTAAHYEAIRKYGILPEHRKSFLKKILGE